MKLLEFIKLIKKYKPKKLYRVLLIHWPTISLKLKYRENSFPKMKYLVLAGPVKTDKNIALVSY
jgi:hypothetical protein